LRWWNRKKATAVPTPAAPGLEGAAAAAAAAAAARRAARHDALAEARITHPSTPLVPALLAGAVSEALLAP